jgi:hypothetical protein
MTHEQIEAAPRLAERVNVRPQASLITCVATPLPEAQRDDEDRASPILLSVGAGMILGYLAAALCLIAGGTLLASALALVCFGAGTILCVGALTVCRGGALRVVPVADDVKCDGGAWSRAQAS